MKDTKELIIDKAFTLFKEQSYDKVTINQICNECNITKTTFYRYLSSKEDILTYFFSSINDELGELAIEMASTSNRFSQIISIFNLIIRKMNLFGKELYSQLFICNLKKYNGSFDEIPSLKKLVTIMIEKAQKENQIENKENSDLLYDYCSTIVFGCGIRWCLGLIDNPADSYVLALQNLLQVKNEYKINNLF